MLNLQGDVVQLVEHTQTLLLYRLNTVATYTYNAWGEIVSATGEMAEINPLRYRGYYYDVETGFYYLQSRYYDPSLHRFINADSLASTGQGIVGTNMFAYCLNNPNVYADGTGNSALKIGTGADFSLYGGGGRYDGGMIPTGVPTPPPTTVVGNNQRGYSEAVGVKKSPVLSNPIDWKVCMDWVAGIGSIGTTVVGTLATAGVISIPVVGQVAIGVVGIALSVWGIGRLAKLW